MLEIIKINGKDYNILNKIDMEHIPHINQCLKALWLLNKDRNEKTYNIFIRRDYNWTMIDMQGSVVAYDFNFLNFLRETKQEELWNNKIWKGGIFR